MARELLGLIMPGSTYGDALRWISEEKLREFIKLIYDYDPVDRVYRLRSAYKMLSPAEINMIIKNL